MAVKVVARFEGVEEAVRNLDEIERRVLNKGLKEAYMEAADVVAEEAGRRAPIGATGRLARSIVTEWASRKRQAKVGPHKDAYYGIFQERGTSRHAAQPFLRPALDARASQVFQIIGRRLKSVMEAK